MRLILVRHAMPVATPDAPPGSWPLSEEGTAAAGRLVALLPDDAYFVSSTERKAIETLVGRVEHSDARFDEVARGDEPFDGDFRRRRREWVEGTAHDGWESQPAAATRFAEGVAAALDRAELDGRAAAVIASHGMVLTNWLVHAGYVPPAEAGEFWSDLRLPDCWQVTGSRLSR